MSDRAPDPPAAGDPRSPLALAPQQYDSLHDPLTGLPNRVLLMDRLGQALARARRHGRRLALLFVDLDRFKAINDTYGHLAGDDLLVSVAQRLCFCLRPEDTVARLGGDEFVVVLDGIDSADDAELVADRILAALGEPFTIQQHRLVALASMGIVIGDGSEEAEDLLSNADAAMYRAKARGGGPHLRFAPEMQQPLQARRRLAAELLMAERDDQLRLFFQPIVELASGRLLAQEALLRWCHPERGRLDPAAFLGVAEQSGLILSIGGWVLEEACRQACDWRSAGHRPPAVSVNLSRAEICRPHLADEIAAVLRRTGLPPSRLWLELPDSALLLHPESLANRLTVLQQLGVGVCLDGFGLHCSSLETLRRLPLDGLKIDRSFVARVEQSAADLTIARTMVELGLGLGLMVIAEGIEKPSQRRAVERLGCQAGQGFLLGVPADLGEPS